MTVELHKDDRPPGRHFGHAVAIDTETLGLNPYRDRLCLVQLSRGDGNAELVQLRRHYEAPELKRLLADESVLAWSSSLPFVKLPDADGYAPETGWIDGFPAGVERLHVGALHVPHVVLARSQPDADDRPRR